MDLGAFLVAAVVAMAVGVGGDLAADRKECSEKLVSLATCLTFVQGQAPAPTPDCCAGLKTVLQTSPKCLCVLVKDRDDPDLGLKINVTRALGLPAACSAPANISNCPSMATEPAAQLQGRAGVRAVCQATGSPEQPQWWWVECAEHGRTEEHGDEDEVVGNGSARSRWRRTRSGALLLRRRPTRFAFPASSRMIRDSANHH